VPRHATTGEHNPFPSDCSDQAVGFRIGLKVPRWREGGGGGDQWWWRLGTVRTVAVAPSVEVRVGGWRGSIGSGCKGGQGGEGPAVGGGLAGSRLNCRWAVGGAGGGVSKEEEDCWGKLFIMFNSTTILSLNIFGHQDDLHFVFQSLEVI
jgi:hypothetical protein